MKPESLRDRVVLITGATGGLGAATAIACARAGATPVLLGRKVKKLEKVYDACVEAGCEPLPAIYPLDLHGATPQDYAELAQRIEANLGRLDGLVHCAADFAGLTPLELTEPAAFARAVHVNFTAPLLLTRACLPLLKRGGDAAIAFAVNDVALTSQAYWGAYGAMQPALLAAVAQLRAELNGRVRVAALQPGPMRTALRGRAWAEDNDAQLRDPADYAAACVRLLTP